MSAALGSVERGHAQKPASSMIERIRHSRQPITPANVLKLKDPVGLFLIQFKDE
jgi:hypothetical protein